MLFFMMLPTIFLMRLYLTVDVAIAPTVVVVATIVAHVAPVRKPRKTCKNT